MDPLTISRLGQIRQQEILEWAANDRGSKPARQYLSDLGRLLIRVGRRLENAAGPGFEARAVAPLLRQERRQMR